MHPGDIVITDGVIAQMAHAKWEQVQARIAELEAAVREMQKSVPGGAHCDPQSVADRLREIAENVGVKIGD